MRTLLASLVAAMILLPALSPAQSLSLGFDRGGSFTAATYSLSTTPLGKSYSLEFGPFAGTRLANGQTGAGMEVDVRRTWGMAYVFAGVGYGVWTGAKKVAAVFVGLGVTVG